VSEREEKRKRNERAFVLDGRREGGGRREKGDRANDVIDVQQGERIERDWGLGWCGWLVWLLLGSK